MSEPKKHHYVPQFILRHFGQGKKRKERIWTFDKKRKASFVCSVKEAAHENQFYNGTNKDGDTLKAEGLMAHVDGLGSRAIRDMVATESIPLHGEHFVGASYFIAAQMLRVPNTRNEMEFLRKAIIAKWGPNIRYGDDERTAAEYTAEDSKYSSISSLDLVPEFAKILQTKVWFLAKASGDARFLLSDNPVVRHNHLDYGPRGSLGLRQDGIDIYLPITPTLALEMLCPKMAFQLSLTAHGRLMLALQRQGRAVPWLDEHVTFVNSLQVIHSERYLFAQRQGDFQLALEMLQQHPDLAIPASEKIIAN